MPAGMTAGVGINKPANQPQALKRSAWGKVKNKKTKKKRSTR